MGQDDSAFAPLVWGVKTSLVNYVRGLEDGQLAVQSPATVMPPAAGSGEGERFAFAPEPQGSHFNSATCTGHLRFQGSVVFSGHFNTLRVLLADPRLDLTEGQGTLSVRTGGAIGTPRWDAIATAKVRSPSPPAQPGLALDLDLFLTAAGRLLLGQQYPVGQALAPATVATVHAIS